MNEFFIHTITDTATGSRRFVIAQEAVTLGLSLTETVTARETLAARFNGEPVTVVARQQAMPPGLRDKLLAMSVSSLQAFQSGDTLAKSLFGE